MQQIADFNPGDSTTYPVSQTFFLPGNPGMLAIINDSPYTLGFQFNEGTVRTCPAGMCRAWPTTQSMKSLTFAVTQAPAAAGQAQISQCVIEYYYENEPSYEQFPAALTRLITIGNNVPVGTSATSVQNDGNPAGTSVVEAKASGLTSSAVVINNDGTVSIMVISNGVQVNALTITPGGASTPATVQINGASTAIVAANGDNIVIGEVGGGPYEYILEPPNHAGQVSVWYARTWDASGTAHLTEFASQNGGIPASQILSGYPAANLGTGALPAGVTVAASQVGTGYPAANLGAGALPAGVTVAASQVGTGYPAANLTGTIPAANVGTGYPAADLGAGTVPSGVVLPAANLDGNPLPVAGGKTVTGFQKLSVSSSGTYSHGIGVTPDGVLVNTDNGSNSTTTGSGSYTSSSVYVYIFNPQTCCVLIYKAG